MINFIKRIVHGSCASAFKWLLVFAIQGAFISTCFGQIYTLEIRRYTKVVGPRIVLGKLCKVVPDSREFSEELDRIFVGRSAPPSESKDITLSFLKLKLRAAGLLKKIRRINGPKIIRVTTAHKDITRLKLKEAVAAYIGREFSSKNIEWKLDFQRVPEKCAVPVSKFELEFKPQGKIKSGYNVVSLLFKTDGVIASRAKVAFKLKTYQNVAVALKRIPIRTILNRDAVGFELRETTHMASAPIREDELTDSLQTRVFISKGKVLHSKMVEKKPLISKGDKVRLKVKAGSVILTSNAIAQESGFQRNWIRVWNIKTRRVVKGQIMAKGEVWLEL